MALYGVLRRNEAFSSLWDTYSIIIAEYILLTALPTLSALWLVRKASGHKGIIAFFGFRTKEWWYVAIGIGMGTSAFLCFVGFAWITGNYHISGIRTHYVLLSLIWLISIVPIGVISEECLFRGYILPTLEQRWGTGTALAVTSLLFALGHGRFGQGNTCELVIHPILHALALGALLGAAYLVRRSLWLPIGIHLAWNFCGAIFFNSPTYAVQSLVRYSYRPHAFDLTGIAFCGSVAICSIAAFLLLLYTKQQKNRRR